MKREVQFSQLGGGYQIPMIDENNVIATGVIQYTATQDCYVKYTTLRNTSYPTLGKIHILDSNDNIVLKSDSTNATNTAVRVTGQFYLPKGYKFKYLASDVEIQSLAEGSVTVYGVL